MQDALLKPGQSLAPNADPVMVDNPKFYRQNKDALTDAMKKFEGGFLGHIGRVRPS